MKTKISLLSVFICFFLFTLNAEKTNVALNAAFTCYKNDGVSNGTATRSNPANALDGDENTYWESDNSFSQIFCVDLGSMYDISKIVLKWNDKYYPTAITLSYSNAPITHADNEKNRIFDISDYKPKGDGPVTDIFEAELSEGSYKIDAFTARYVAFRTRGRNIADAGYQLNEFEIYGEKIPEDDSGNIAKFKNITACFNENNCKATADGSSPSNAVDGDAETYWESVDNAVNMFLCVDLEKEYEISKIVIKWGDEAYPDGTASESSRMSIRYSTEDVVNKDETSAEVISFAYPRASATENQIDVFGEEASNPLFQFENFTARYVGLRMKRLSTVGYLRIKELEIYGTEITDPGPDTRLPENNAEFNIFPNPVTDILHISTKSTMKNINILSLSGNVIESYVVNSNLYNISTSNWKPGPYLLKIETDEGIQVQKIVK